jgi:hypothetical protein
MANPLVSLVETGIEVVEKGDKPGATKAVPLALPL